MHKKKANISDFWIVGINYKKTDASIRGQFAINNQQYSDILTIAPEHGLNELFLLSTCNRTEVYGMAASSDQLIDLLCTQTEGTRDTFARLSYVKNGLDAINHLFNVSAGLDSQILGDYEIIGQLKQAAKFAKKHGFIGAFFERLLNSVLQSSKAIKTNTSLSDGTVSVSFAAIQYIKEHVSGYKNKNFVLLGTGKIGSNVCRNIVDYLHAKKVTLINRTEEKAALIAQETGVKHAPLNQLAVQLHAADIVLVSTNAAEPTILKRDLENAGNKLIIDLSIPCNVESEAQKLPNIKLIHVDELSRIKDDTLQKRIAEVPKAKAIIEAHIAEFIEWYGMRKYAPALVLVKNKLQEINTHHAPAEDADSEQKIQKVINVMARKVRGQNMLGCHFIEAINEFIA